jgi:hypothetical protein
VGTVNVGSHAPICPPLFIVALCERGVTTIHDRRLRSKHGSDRFFDPEITFLTNMFYNNLSGPSPSLSTTCPHS